MKKFTLLSILSLCLFLTITTTINAQNVVGTYSSVRDNSTLIINDAVGTSDGINATINNITIPGRPGYTIASMNLKGTYHLEYQSNTSNEQFYLLNLAGIGIMTGPDGRTQYPVALSLSGYRTSKNAISLTSQIAVAYEFAGNAEDVGGKIIAWTKD